MEMVKTLGGRGEDPRSYFWRTSAGIEVDLLVETGGMLVPIEVKLASTPLPAMAALFAPCGKTWAAGPDPGTWSTAAMGARPSGLR